MKNFTVTIMLALMIAFSATAQDEKLAQFSFFYPVGTSGIGSIHHSYKFSLNTLWGVNGGVNGFEIGSIANVNRGNVFGGQISGICNVTTGNSYGAIISGVANSSLGRLDGAAISGVINFAGDSCTGGHVAGVANVALGGMNGAMISGVVNYSKYLQGGQISTINVVSGEMTGAQVGVINVANRAKGLQLGVINVCNDGDSILPVGVINFVRNGYFALELSANELMMANLTFKMGVERFHTLYRIGAGIYNKNQYVTYGMGFGSIIPITTHSALNIEAISESVAYNKQWDNNLNLLNTLNLQYQYNITDFLSVKAGPSIRTYITNQKVEGVFNTINVPYTLYEYTGSSVKTSVWVGFNAGIVLSL